MKTVTEPASDEAQEIIKRINKIRAKLDKIVEETSRHKDLAEQLKKQKDEALKTVDLTNPEAFEQVSFLQRKCDIIPGRLKAFAEEREKLMAELNDECGSLIFEHRKTVQARLDELTGKIATAIAPFFEKGVEYVNDAVRMAHERETGMFSAASAADRIAGNSIAGRALVNQVVWLKNDNLLSRPADRKAPALISLVNEFEALKF
jgi:hypothetical protein